MKNSDYYMIVFNIGVVSMLGAEKISIGVLMFTLLNLTFAILSAIKEKQ